MTRVVEQVMTRLPKVNDARLRVITFRQEEGVPTPERHQRTLGGFDTSPVVVPQGIPHWSRSVTIVP